MNLQDSCRRYARRCVFGVAVVFGLLTSTASGASESWPASATNWKAVKPNEHPRLLFRASDLPALRRKARTPEGKVIVERLKKLIGHDELEIQCNPHPTRNVGPKGMTSLPVGAFTVFHPAGNGMLYQLTGDKRCAVTAREQLEKLLDGQPDRDERYAWKRPGTGFRLGIVNQGVAMAYDLCHDAWPGDFRRRVVKAILEQSTKSHAGNGGKPITLEFLCKGVGYPPGSNHAGAAIGGAGMAVLAVRGDDGADAEQVEALMEQLDKSIKTQLTKAFGDHGWFAENIHPGRIASNTGITPLLQSMKIAAGRDYITPRPNGQYLSLRWVYEIVPIKGRAHIPSRGPYGGHDLYRRAPMISHSGEFSIGMGAVDPKYVPAMAWTYHHFVEPGQAKVHDAIMYPHQCIYALVNWPITDRGVQTVNPGDVLPRTLHDSIHHYFLFRNRWQDANDVVVTVYAGGGPRGYHKPAPGPVLVLGMGKVLSFGRMRGKVDHYSAEADGSGLVTVAGTGLAVCFSGIGDADAAVVMAGNNARLPSVKGDQFATRTVDAGGASYHVLTLSASGEHPSVRAQGDSVVVGKREVTWDGQRMRWGDKRPRSPTSSGNPQGKGADR